MCSELQNNLVNNFHTLFGFCYKRQLLMFNRIDELKVCDIDTRDKNNECEDCIYLKSLILFFKFK